jgi:hypothetical protein
MECDPKAGWKAGCGQDWPPHSIRKSSRPASKFKYVTVHRSLMRVAQQAAPEGIFLKHPPLERYLITHSPQRLRGTGAHQPPCDPAYA